MRPKQMGRPDLVAAARKKFGMTLPVADDVVSWLFDTIADQVASGGSVVIRGFGAFHPRHVPARQGINPNGVPFTSAPKTTLHFAPGEPLLERLKEEAASPTPTRST